MLEKENAELAEFVQGQMTGTDMSGYGEEGKQDATSANALSAGLVGRYNDE